jgi:4-amino-4-deoxy-L-arabinose transferase-like glycosyltransferase
LIETRYIPQVGELVRRNLRFFLIFSAAALLLRLVFIFHFPGVVTDSFLYGDIAKNWLEHGIYGLGGGQEISPTYIRLPGYPAFLAAVFALFGMEHYRAVLFLQMLVDLGTCFLCADLALRLLGSRPAKIAFVLASLSPFLADYAAAALTETLEIFFTALAFDLATRALQPARARPVRLWAACGLASAGAILLRPDGVMVLMAIEIYLLSSLLKLRLPNRPATMARGRVVVDDFLAAVLMGGLALAPLVPWAIRNWRVFHEFQPLAPRYANQENEFVPMGFNRWVKTWMVDYVSVEEIYWQEPGSAIDPTKLPSRAFDSPAQKAETFALIADYNQLVEVTPELDERFEALAEARIRANRFRYYLELPLLRILDMWLRPRTEMLPADSRWWEFNDELKWSALAVVFGVIGLFYVLWALVGWAYSRGLPLTGLLVLFVVLRSGFLGTLENPEPRYTLEMYPMVMVFASYALAGVGQRRRSA